jgi:Tol biopolymer transport system component
LVCPAWSPDGAQIAFHGGSGPETGVYVVPALGGPEKKLRSTHRKMGPYLAGAISWSPDGKWIAFEDSLPPNRDVRLFLLSVETLESTQIPHVPACQTKDYLRSLTTANSWRISACKIFKIG